MVEVYIRAGEALAYLSGFWVGDTKLVKGAGMFFKVNIGELVFRVADTWLRVESVGMELVLAVSSILF